MLLYQQYRYYLFLALTVVAVCLINFYIPLFADDYGFFFIFNESGRVTHLSDILVSQYNYHNSWGGRNVAHFMLQFLLMLQSKMLLALVKTLWFFLTILVAIVLAYGTDFRQKLTPQLWFIIVAGFWVLHPCLGESSFWITGACNYLFTPLLVLCFLLPFRFLIDSIIKNQVQIVNPLSSMPWLNFIFKVIWLVLAFFAGWSNENFVIGGFLLIVLCLFFCYRYKQKVAPYFYLGILFFGIGAYMLISAPGNQVRIATDVDWMHMPKYIIFIQHFGYFLRNELAEILIFIVFIFLYRQCQLQRFKQFALLVFATGVLIDFIMIFSPEMPWRTFTCGFLLKFVAIVALFDQSILLKPKIHKLIILLYLIFIISLLHALIAYVILYKYDIQRLSIIEHADKNSLVAIPLYPFKNREAMAVYSYDITTNKDSGINQGFARYYKLSQGVVGYEGDHAKKD